VDAAMLPGRAHVYDNNSYKGYHISNCFTYVQCASLKI